MTEREHWNLAVDLFMESLYRPDPQLRAQARDFGCYDELMQIRSLILDEARTLHK